MCLCVVNLLLPGLDGPFPPRGDDLHSRGKALDGKLESDLVVSLSGAAVSNRIGTFCKGDLSELLSYDRSCECCSEKVGLIHCIHLQCRDDDVIDHLVDKICDDEL